jgi:hypothetical protein
LLERALAERTAPVRLDIEVRPDFCEGLVGTLDPRGNDEAAAEAAFGYKRADFNFVGVGGRQRGHRDGTGDDGAE